MEWGNATHIKKGNKEKEKVISFSSVFKNVSEEHFQNYKREDYYNFSRAGWLCFQGITKSSTKDNKYFFQESLTYYTILCKLKINAC